MVLLATVVLIKTLPVGIGILGTTVANIPVAITYLKAGAAAATALASPVVAVASKAVMATKAVVSTKAAAIGAAGLF